MTALAGLILALAFPARAEKLASFRLALIEQDGAHMSVLLDESLESVLRREKSSSEEARVLPCYFSGEDYRFRLPATAIESSTMSAIVLETGGEATILFPADESLAAALIEEAREPSGKARPFSLVVASRPITIELAQAPDGAALVSALVDPGSESGRWQSTVVSVRALDWRGRKLQVAMIGKSFGGIARQASALADERRRAGGPLVGLARRGTFGGPESELKGRAMAEALEHLGTGFSAVSSSELRDAAAFFAYRAERPGGIRYLSANIVYSSAPATPFFEPYALFSAGGATIAVTALTPPIAATYLPAARLSHLIVRESFDALAPYLAELQKKADFVVLLMDYDSEGYRLRSRLAGIDLIAAEDWELGAHGQTLREARIAQRGRGEYENPLWVMGAAHAGLSVLEVELKVDGAKRELALAERHRRLDPSVASAPGYPEFDPETFGIDLSTQSALLPAARRLFGAGAGAFDTIGPHQFWPMAASFLAERTGSEAAIVEVPGLALSTDAEIKEPMIRAWLARLSDELVILRLRGAELKGLLRDSREQYAREKRGLSPGGKVHYTVGGVDEQDRVSGAPIEDNAVYRVAATRLVADGLELNDKAHESRPYSRPPGELILGELRRQAGAPPERYRDWMEGRPMKRRGLWTLRVRELGLNIRNTKVVRDDAFDNVPNSRIQGFDERLVGFSLKSDFEYLRESFKWTNTAEAEYARSRIRPRNQPALTNTTANRLMLRTTGTRRWGGIPVTWLARSWGPSMGFQFDGEFEASPGLRRKEIYSVFPGVELFDGSVVRTVSLSGNFRRDFSEVPPNNQYGLRIRTLVSTGVGPGRASTLEGEFFTNYFFKTPTDRPNNLQVEGDAAVRLRVPVWKHLSVAPFLDFYFFELKARPIWGYSVMSGVTIAFSRVWKPQYERF